MNTLKEKKVLISGASIAGLSTAYWMNTLGYQVTVIEIANEPRIAGAAIDIRGTTVDIAKRMGIYEQLIASRLQVELVEFKNADDTTAGSISLKKEDTELPDDDIEVERDKFLNILLDALQDEVEFIFNDSIVALAETTTDIQVSFKHGQQRTFDLLLGCDGSHSGVRKIWFGEESEYAHFLEGYFSISTVNKLIIPQKTMQLFNVPDKAITLNAYNNKTDIIFCFYSGKEIPYDYRDVKAQREIILAQFAGLDWRTIELLEEVQQANNFYFDKFCQIKMPCWTKGRVALVGDAAYCASPAAGMGASLSIEGAAALADALQKYEGNFTLAFQDYDKNLRPFIEEVQAMAELNVRENFIPRTEEAILKRNTEGF
ncbi:FAD-dependent monooxygenase [Pedobacter sp. MC2016-24]|uniref:FAD-dependent monooxygenase n=1 Tax=Pedobacter sp. MC2016-24 TaxID=2780090 RepID=UPI0018819091|nr:FAD-dependent monooxygenase [Pedobacter sp. MC2016-24]MBE9601852.1 FAD-dependent monooxygenase [Pedobacter sp. MC2016-24]